MARIGGVQAYTTRGEAFHHAQRQANETLGVLEYFQVYAQADNGETGWYYLIGILGACAAMRQCGYPTRDLRSVYPI